MGYSVIALDADCNKLKIIGGGIDAILLDCNSGSMQGLQSSQRLTVLLILATAGLYALDLQLAASSDHILSGMYFLPFIAGMVCLPLAPLSLLAALVWALALVSTQLGPEVAGSTPTLYLLVETAAIGLCLWAARLRDRLERTRVLLETMQRHAPVGIALLDQQGRINQLNPAMEQLLGQDGQLLLGQPWETLSSHRAEAGEARCQQLRTPNGWRHVDVVCRVWPGAVNGRDQGLLVQALDCQQRVEAQEALQAERNQLQQTLRTSLLSSALVHEIKQPLAALLLQCRRLLIQQEQEPEVSRGFGTQLGEVLSSAEQLQRSVDAVAVLLRHGDHEPPSEPFDLCALINSCLSAQTPWMTARHVVVDQVGFEQPLAIRGEPGIVRILVDNLLRNGLEALEACPAGQRRLQLVLRRLPPNVELTISDSGPGLPDTALNNLRLRSSKPSGLGIGLFTAETIAQQHGGNLEAGRCPQLGGASLRLTLPLGRGQGLAGNGAAPPDAPAQNR